MFSRIIKNISKINLSQKRGPIDLVRWYNPVIVEHFNNPKNVGKFNKDDSNVGTGLVGAPACGDVVKLQIKVDENDKIIDSKIKVFGCGSAIANTSYTSELIKNMTLDEALKVDSKDIAKATGSKEIKLHCSMLAEEAIQAAVNDIKNKKKKCNDKPKCNH